jgi:Methyltransferase FkbM domain
MMELMKLKTFDGHTIDVDLLTPGGWVLDAGCRGFKFSKAMADLGCRVVALDPSSTVGDPSGTQIIFSRQALRKEESWVDVAEKLYGTTVSTSVLEGNGVPAVTITSFIGRPFHGATIDIFDAVKLDIEGSEYEVLMNWPGPVAKQISVEFHDFVPGWMPADYSHEACFAHLSQWYKVVQHEWTFRPEESGECDPWSYWDSVLVLK